VYNVVPVKSAADVFKHYVTFYNDYGEKTERVGSEERF
jgi:hypothetical protein